jgi:spermidine synthase
MLDTVPFYLNCRERLTRRGMVAVNLLDRRRGVAPSVERMREAFDGRVLVLPPCEAGNTVALAASGDAIEESFGELRDAAEALKTETGLNLAPTLARLIEARGGGLELRL